MLRFRLSMSFHERNRCPIAPFRRQTVYTHPHFHKIFFQTLRRLLPTKIVTNKANYSFATIRNKLSRGVAVAYFGVNLVRKDAMLHNIRNPNLLCKKSEVWKESFHISLKRSFRITSWASTAELIEYTDWGKPICSAKQTMHEVDLAFLCQSNRT